MDKRTLENIMYKVETAIKEIADKQSLNNSDLEAITKLLCVLEHINKVTDGIVSYSENGNSYRGNYHSNRSYDGGNSNTSGNSYNDRNSYNGYSGHDLRGKLLQQLEEIDNFI